METYLEQVKKPDLNHYEKCLQFAMNWINRKDVFTSEELINDFKEQTEIEPKEPRVWGAVMRELSNKGLIIPVGYTTYKGKQGHGKPTRMWMLKKEWL